MWRCRGVSRARRRLSVRSPLAQPRVHALVADDAGLYRTASQRSFQQESSLLERPAGGEVVGVWLGKDALQVERVKRPGCDTRYGLGGDPPSPVFAAEPVAKFRGETMHVVLPVEANAADAARPHHDGEAGKRVFGENQVDEGGGIGDAVGVREAITQLRRNARVVGMLRQGFGVGGAQGAHRAVR